VVIPRPVLAASLSVDARLQRRAVTIDDLDAVVELLAASDLAVLGRTDHTPDEVAKDLRDEDIRHEGWYDDRGALVAYGFVMRSGESSKVVVDCYAAQDADPSVGPDLVTHLENRAAEVAAEAGHDHAVLHTGVYRQDERTASWLRGRGFTVGTTFTRMRIDLDPQHPVEVPALPQGVEIRRTDGSEDDLRTGHRLQEEAFTEHYGHVARDFAHYRKRFEERGPGWSTLYLVELDGEPVAELIGTKQFEDDDDCGYVRSIGVLSGGRGRGIAKALLRQYFAHCQAQGRAGVLLHVDVSNVTNALGVYQSVGMRSGLEIDAWAKTVTAPAARAVVGATAATAAVDAGTPA
jgi:mycothiol synthase